MPEQVSETAAARGAELTSILTLQEYEPGAARDKTAHRRGTAMLDALERLQNSMLGTAGEPTDELAALARLAAMPLDAADPGLAELLAAIRLRAKIELLQRGVESG